MAKLNIERVREDYTKRIMDAMERNIFPWRKPWVGENSGFPTNVVSKKRYRGVNPVMLDLTAMEKGYSSKWWGTYAQWAKKLGQVRKGEKGEMIVFWEARKYTKDEEEKTYFVLKYYKVFNLDQVDSVFAPNKVNIGNRQNPNWVEGIPVGQEHPLDLLRPKPAQTFDHDSYQPAEDIIVATGADITYGGNKAFYSPAEDRIQCPEKSVFPKLQDFYHTMFHELAHWSEKRTGFSDLKEKSYALGELVAEMAGGFVCEELGVPVENADENDAQHAAYLQSWLRALKDDTKFIFVASKWASKAADLILGDEQQAEEEETEEQQQAA